LQTTDKWSALFGEPDASFGRLLSGRLHATLVGGIRPLLVDAARGKWTASGSYVVLKGLRAKLSDGTNLKANLGVMLLQPKHRHHSMCPAMVSVLQVARERRCTKCGLARTLGVIREDSEELGTAEVAKPKLCRFHLAAARFVMSL